MMEDSGHHRAQWQLLPPCLLAQVFSELSEFDRCSAGSTCDNWAAVCLLPRFWRQHCFTMGCGENKEEVVSACAREVLYMKTVGCHLTDMELWIDISYPRVKGMEQTMSKAVEDLLQSIPPGMKLKTFACNALFLWLGKPRAIKASLLNAVFKLLNQQSKYLTEIQLETNCFLLKEGCQVLQALAIPATHPSPASSATDPPSGLSVMKLDNFFDCTKNPAAYPKFAKVMGMFGALRILELEFTYLNDKVLKNLCTGSPFLKTLSLLIADTKDSDMIDYTLVTAVGWREAVQHCPDLQVLVKIFVIDFESGINVERVFVPGMPLISLAVFLGLDDSKMAALLTHLSQHFVSCLELLHLTFNEDTDTWNWTSELVDLVSRCISLNCLSITDVIVPLDCLLEMATARVHSASLSPIKEQLQIHLDSCDNALGYRDLQRLSNIRDIFYIQICHHDVCYPHPHKAIMLHESRS